MIGTDKNSMDLAYTSISLWRRNFVSLQHVAVYVCRCTRQKFLLHFLRGVIESSTIERYRFSSKTIRFFSLSNLLKKKFFPPQISTISIKIFFQRLYTDDYNFEKKTVNDASLLVGTKKSY